MTEDSSKQYDNVILITGDRNWNNYPFIYDNLKTFKDKLDTGNSSFLLIHGDCKGADRAAKELGFDISSNPADWETYKKAAGPIRNVEMIKETINHEKKGSNAFVVAFHDDLSTSKGTKHCVESASKKGLTVFLFSSKD